MIVALVLLIGLRLLEAAALQVADVRSAVVQRLASGSSRVV
ncbi:MAG TPA: hypothetical protein VF526_20685 [Solirubrobacteraceae bacterium]